MNSYQAQPIRLALIRALSKTTPPDRPREILDSAAGLILRHQPSGYLGIYASLGRGKRESLCDARRIIDSNSTLTLGKVKNQAQLLRGKAASGHDFKSERDSRRAIPTLQVFLDDTYGPWVVQNRRSGEATLNRINACFAKTCGKLKLDKITPARLEPWRTRRQKQGIAAETINRDVAALRAALTRAVKLELINKNPVTGFDACEVDRHKQTVRALTADEKAKLIETLQARDAKKRQERVSSNEWRAKRSYQLKPRIGRFADVLTPAVIVSLETGLRRGELFAVVWPSVDFTEKMLRVEGRTAKTYETRSIPLNETAIKTLRDWWLQSGQPKTGYVFTLDGGRLGNLKKSYYAVIKAAQIERINGRAERMTWHSLRHTFGSLLGAQQVDPTTLMKLMGHANLATTQRYLHTDDERKRAAVELLAGIPTL